MTRRIRLHAPAIIHDAYWPAGSEVDVPDDFSLPHTAIHKKGAPDAIQHLTATHMADNLEDRPIAEEVKPKDTKSKKKDEATNG